MENPDKYTILENATLAKESDVADHFKQFVEVFVKSASRERWMSFLIKRPERIYKHSSKLEECLLEDQCKRSSIPDSWETDSEGIYYDFMDEPIVLTLSDAVRVGMGGDAIFSLTAGKRVALFSHEGWITICTK